MAQILEAMIDFFTTDEWPFSQIEGQAALRTGFRGENGEWTCYAWAREEMEQFVFYSICPTNVPPERRPAMAEFLTRANYGLIIGNFEMDLSDGEVRYKTGIDVEGDRLSAALVKSLVYANVLAMDQYLPGIMRLIYADVSAAEAIVQVEGPARGPGLSMVEGPGLSVAEGPAAAASDDGR